MTAQLISLSDLALRMATAELGARQLERQNFAARLAEIYIQLADEFADIMLIDDLGSAAIDTPIARQRIANHAAKIRTFAEQKLAMQARLTAMTTAAQAKIGHGVPTNAAGDSLAAVQAAEYDPPAPVRDRVSQRVAEPAVAQVVPYNPSSGPTIKAARRTPTPIQQLQEQNR
jgi:hypothetical protein